MTNNYGWPIWIGVVADDLNAQTDYYAGILGLPVLERGEGYAMIDMGGPNRLEILKRDPSLPQYAVRRFQVGFRVEDIQSARAELLAKGVKPVTEILGGADSGAFWCYFEDPEGNLFEITQKLPRD